ncbi:MAG: peptide-methionine (S)-S-oxide reductase MsrA [Myxococcales bacterium]|nr:peptide-methionine (S)-S-oxide reductase MsrA [Myxococcales bacterium]
MSVRSWSMVTSRRAVLVALVLLGACDRGGERATPTARPAPADPSAPAGPAPEPITPAAGPGHEVAILAGGCFWGMEELLRQVDGVVDTEVGYIGGDPATARYDLVHRGDTGHAESVKVEFDPARLSYEVLLQRWYFRMHDPTTLDRQGNDRGSQYRSTIFYTTAAQRSTALAVRARVDASGVWPTPVVTTVEPASVFTAAEADHQDYLQANPDGYTCHFLRE